jgi:hypothetical protein
MQSGWKKVLERALGQELGSFLQQAGVAEGDIKYEVATRSLLQPNVVVTNDMRPGDVFVRNFDGSGIDRPIDITVRSLYGFSAVIGDYVVTKQPVGQPVIVGGVAKSAEVAKHSKYDDTLVQGLELTAFAMDSSGLLGVEAHNFIVKLSDMAARAHPEIAGNWQGGDVAYAGFLRSTWLQRLTAVYFRELGDMIAHSYPRIVLPARYGGIRAISVPTAFFFLGLWRIRTTEVGATSFEAGAVISQSKFVCN